jgi:hypothetical protein
MIPAAGIGAGVRRLSGGRFFAPSGDWASGNPAQGRPRGEVPGFRSFSAWPPTEPDVIVSDHPALQ